MVQQNCVACNTPLMGDPGSRVLCPRCGRSNTIALMAPPGAGTFQPTPVPQPTLAPPPMGPRKTHPPAIISLVLGILAFVLGGVTGFGGAGFVDGDFGVFPLIGLACAIAALVLGIVSVKEINRRPNELQGKGMAIAGLVLGIVFLALIAVAFIMVLIFIALCAAACGRAGGNAYIPTGIPVFGISLGARIRREAALVGNALRSDPWGAVFLHHPRCSAFRDDAVSTGAGPVCASCLSLFVGSLVAAVFFRALDVSPSPALLAAGLAVALWLHAASVLGLTSTRLAKMTARGMLGVGVFAAGASLPTLGSGAWIVVAAIVAAGFALVYVRAQGIDARLEGHRHEPGCGVTPSI